MHGNVERCARDEVLVVNIPGVNPRRSAADAARDLGRSDTHAAEKRMQRNLNAGSEARDHALFIERNNFYFWIRIIFRQISAAGAESIVGVRNGELRGEDAHFEKVANFRAS